MRRLVAMCGLCCVLLTGCAQEADVAGTRTPSTVVVGSGDSLESEVLAQIYAGTLARTGLQVATDLRLGDRTAYLGELDSGRVTVVPEATGALLNYLDPRAAEREPDDVFRALNKSLPEGLSLSDFAAAEQRPQLVVAESFARDRHLDSIADLAPLCGATTLGIADGAADPTEISTRYGCRFGAIRHYPADRLGAALSSHEVQALWLPANSPVSAQPDVLALDDPDHATAAQNVVALYRANSFDHAQLVALNAVAGQLTTADLTELVGKVRAGRSSADVAREWLDRGTA